MRELKPMQSQVITDPTRYRVVISGRRAGKTYGACLEMIRAACSKKRSVVWFIAPTLQDCRETAWKELLSLVPPEWVVSVNRTELCMTLVNGSEIQLMSSEKSKRGRGLDFLVMDEFAFYDADVWEAQMRPALADREGRCLFLSTPVGMNWAYDLFLRGNEGRPDWSSHQFTTLEGGLVSQDEVEAARTDMDPRLFRQEFEASFETLAGRVYSNFDRVGNVANVGDLGGTLFVGMDFNVNPMSAVVCVRAVDECHVIDALEIQTSNTEEMGVELKARYTNRHIGVCPDPSGNSRKTSAPVGETDFTILRGHGFEVRAPRRAPSIVDRINNTQAMLLSAGGRRKVLMHPNCMPTLGKALDGLTYKDGTTLPNKNLGLDHISDALGYLLWQEFNVLVDRSMKIQYGGGGGTLSARLR